MGERYRLNQSERPVDSIPMPRSRTHRPSFSAREMARFRRSSARNASERCFHCGVACASTVAGKGL